MNAPDRVAAETDVVVDAARPWLGLSSFSEETRAYFYGREEEVAELARRVQRKLLTVLFGQSGLGKTSILRAGLVPRLRAQGICPVYVRVDYGPDAPSPASQIKDAVVRETAAAGTWTRAGVAGKDESLWEFFHHRDDVLQDAAGLRLTPLLIFDQFEEIFTLAQSDDAGRKRAARFLDALAELAENRPSAELEARLEEDDSAVERFDFARSDYRILITLREDYLAHLESLKEAMPSITQNRMRLAPMRGEQALDAVLRPGGKLVTEEVAEAIVRFVAGGAELAHAQVEPSLLSLICRELNEKRLAAGRDVISLDLLAGSHDSILSDFYERSLADQPASVRAAIEDLLLTSSGYRENVAEERVLEVLAAAGASPDAGSVLALLVNRRLLRIEDRLDIRRVELTHDVLCGVVQQSRALRQEREKQARAELALQEQRERELAARRALARARRTAAVCMVLAVAAVAGGAIGYASMRRAQETQALADRSRGQAEALMNYLLEDFYEELLPVGRLDMLDGLTTRTIAYYDGLPAAARTDATITNRALALQLSGSVKDRRGNPELAAERARESLAQMQPMIDRGNASEQQKLVYARALGLRAFLLSGQANFGAAREATQRAIELLQPIATKAGATMSSRLLYARTLTYSGWNKMRSNDYDAARKDLRAAQAVLGTPAERSASIPLAVAYASANQWNHELLARFDVKDYAAADKLARETLDSIEQVLRQRPNHISAVRIRDSITLLRAHYGLEQRRVAPSLAILDGQLAIGEARLQAEPGSVTIRDGLAIFLGTRVNALVRLGRIADANAAHERQMRLYDGAQPGPYQVINLLMYAEDIGTVHAELGDSGQLQGLLEQMKQWNAIRRKAAAPETAAIYDIDIASTTFNLKAIAGDAGATIAAADALIASSLDKLASAKGNKGDEYLQRVIAAVSLAAARLAYEGADYVNAERYGAQALKYESLGYPAEPANAPYVLEHALSLARLQRADEARKALAPELAALRAAQAQGADDQFLRLDLAKALLVQSICDPGRARPSLREAQTLLAGMAPALQQYRSVRIWRDRIETALKGTGDSKH